MTAETRKTILSAVIAAVLATVLLVLSLRLRRLGETPASPAGGDGSQNVIPVIVDDTEPPPGDAMVPPPPPPPPPPPTDAAAPDEARPSEREAAADDGPEPKDTDEFTAEEAEHAAAPVILDAGRYAVRAGEEFDVTLTLTAPALSNVMLLMEFDPALLACLPASGKRVGWTFRQDIEFYANNDKGQLILISQGQPGAKHTRAVVDRPVASFRLKAKAAGQTALKFPAKGVEFTTAKGVAAEAPQLRGGAIEIR